MLLAKTYDEWDWWEEDYPKQRGGFKVERYTTADVNNTRQRVTSPQAKNREDHKRDGSILMIEKGMTPLAYLQSVMEGEELPSMAQMQAATAILPYRHKKMPTAIENTGTDGAPMKIEATVRFIRPGDVV